MSFILVNFTPTQISQVRQLSTTAGFTAAFEENLPSAKTFLEAYEITERAHEQIFGDRRYAGYHTFATCRKKYRDKLRDNDPS